MELSYHELAIEGLVPPFGELTLSSVAALDRAEWKELLGRTVEWLDNPLSTVAGTQGS
ncbi:hypothetical protein ABZ960_23050 [Streptomyces pseudovenezuelae]|uniref:hypothetical protein n=1 Tax=Streptomyces pseudovenezuelae TaxID=67350 RepID=UPI0034A12C48